MSHGAKVWAALAVVYVVWGSTYLGILYAIDTIPVFLSMGIRFVLAGGLLYIWAVRRGDVTAIVSGGGSGSRRRSWVASCSSAATGSSRGPRPASTPASRRS